MKNWFLTGVLAVFTLALVCCNQEEDVQPIEVNKASISNDLSLDADADDYFTITLNDVDSKSRANDAKGDYCVYVITYTSGECGDFGTTDILCVNCPEGGSCPGDSRNKTKWRYVDKDGNEICTGTWIRLTDGKECDECPDKGKTGYVFVD